MMARSAARAWIVVRMPVLLPVHVCLRWRWSRVIEAVEQRTGGVPVGVRAAMLKAPGHRHIHRHHVLSFNRTPGADSGMREAWS